MNVPPPNDANPPILEAVGLTRRFDDLVAVDHVSLSIQPGEVFGLVGLNGAGKSTLIKMFITILAPSEGSAIVCGYDIAKQSAMVRRSIGYVPQMVSADGDLTGYENLHVYANLYDVPRAQRRDRVLESLKFMDLSDVANKLVREYSGGMVRRLEIAQSMLHRPRLLFLDEPTVGLDPVARSSVWHHILNLRRQFNTTILLTTHLLEEVESLCDRVGIMSFGKLAALGTVDELKQSVNGPETSMDDVFVHYAGATEEAAGGFKGAQAMRRTAKRLG